MKILKNLYIPLILVLFFSCNSDEEFINPFTSEDGFAEKAAFVRFEEIPIIIDFSVASPALVTEIVDPAGNVSSYDLSVALNQDTAFFPVTSITSFPTTLNIPVSQIESAVGVPGGTITEGDEIFFQASITRDDGAVFTVENMTGDVFNQGNRQAMQFSVLIACPLASDDFGTGTYVLEQIGGPGDPFFGGPSRWPGAGETTQEVSLVATSPITRQFDATWITFGGTFSFNLLCGDIRWPFQGFPASCGGSGANALQAEITAYNETDDSEFIITITDTIDTDCGLGEDQTYSIRLTKVN